MPFSFPAVQGLLRCPKSRSELVLDGDGLVCVDPTCRLRFSVRDDIPVMLVDEATELSVEQWETALRKNHRDD